MPSPMTPPACNQLNPKMRTPRPSSQLALSTFHLALVSTHQLQLVIASYIAYCPLLSAVLSSCPAASSRIWLEMMSSLALLALPIRFQQLLCFNALRISSGSCPLSTSSLALPYSVLVSVSVQLPPNEISCLLFAALWHERSFHFAVIGQAQLFPNPTHIPFIHLARLTESF